MIAKDDAIVKKKYENIIGLEGFAGYWVPLWANLGVFPGGCAIGSRCRRG